MGRAEGRIAIVTGGASGIGAALARELVAEGAEVVLADRQIELAESLAKELGPKATPAELDVRSFEAFERLAKDTVARTGRIDYLFNNAGIAVGGEIDTYRLEDWTDVFDVNLNGVINGIQAIYPIMIGQGSGHIVNTASVAGLVATAGEGSYGATKYAVVSISKTLRIEAARHGVRVSVLCPGAIRTPILTGGRFGRMNVDVSEEKILELWRVTRPMPPEVFAKKSLAGVFDNDAIIVVPGWWKALWYLDRLSPSLSMKFWGVVLERMRKELR
jgi:NADP-dependent 3-hydroxy acid dehydrogenase YdfG